jgi:hypothetical protein
VICDKEAWYLAWIAVIPPSPRLPHERCQVRFQDGNHQRSAGIFPTTRLALAEQRAIERACLRRVRDRQVVAGVEGSASKPQVRHQKEGRKAHPAHLGDIPRGDLDASTVGAWKAAMVAEGLAPAPSTPTCRCSALFSTPPSTTTVCLAHRCCEPAAPVVPPRPAHRLGRHRTASGGSVHTPGRSQPRRDSLTFRGPRSSMRRPSSSAW